MDPSQVYVEKDNGDQSMFTNLGTNSQLYVVLSLFKVL